jgi:hypothetical protein
MRKSRIVVMALAIAMLNAVIALTILERTACL